MTPAFIGTQQQLWSLWHTNTSLTPCHQGAFFHTCSKGTLAHRLTLKSFSDSSQPNPQNPSLPEQSDAARYKEGRQPIVCMPGVSCVP